MSFLRLQTWYRNPLQELESGHSVVNTRGPPDGRFTFTSHEAGDHTICLSSNYSSSWFGPTAHIRLHLDIVVGSTKANADHDRGHVSALASKIRDLNIKIEDIRREQQYQREREADFRDLSEVTNSRAVWYSVAQIVTLLLTCAWQLRHLRVRTIPTFRLPSTILTNFPAVLRGSEDALVYRCILSIYIIWFPSGKVCLFRL